MFILNNTKEQLKHTITWINLTHYFDQKKLHTTEYILYSSIYMQHPEQAIAQAIDLMMGYVFYLKKEE